MKRTATERDFVAETVRDLMQETQAVSGDISINLRNQTVIKRRDRHERTRRRTVLFIHQSDDGRWVGKINTVNASGHIERVPVYFDTKRHAWKPFNERG